jgi:hypothetical protein
MSITAPGTPVITHSNYSTSVTLDWTNSIFTAPDTFVGGGYYEIQISQSASFTGPTTFTNTSTTNSFTRNMTIGLKWYFRVRARSVQGNYSGYSGSVNKYLVFRGTNDWTNFTNIASNITTTFEFQDLPTATTKNAGLHKKVTQNTSSSTTYTTAQNYIYRDFTGLTIGRTYYATATAALGTASIQGNIYRLQVNTSTPTVGSAVTLTTTSATVPTLTFVATGTTHRIRFELNETFTQTSTGTKEDFILRNFSLYEVLDTPFELQPHLNEMSVSQAFDLASQSVGGYWWVDKKNETNFAQFPLSEVSLHTFTDEVGDEGDLHYIDIEAGYDSRDIVNTVTLNNLGRVPQYDDETKFDSYVINYLSDTDTDSVDEWGARAISLDTNIYTPLITNYVTNPSIEANLDSLSNGASSISRMRRRDSAAYTISGGDIDNEGTRLLALINTAGGAEVDPFWNDGNSGTGIEIKPTVGQQYTAVAHVARITSTADAQALISIRWYDRQGDLISASSSANTTLGLATWRKLTVTANAPANTQTASIRVRITRSGGGNFSSGNVHVVDAVGFFDDANTDYFDGSYKNTSTYLYQWTGLEQQSSSRRYVNNLFTRAEAIETKFAAPQFTVKSVTWNAAEDFTQAYAFDIGQNVTVVFKGETGLYRVTGIEHTMRPESWIVKLKLGKI